MENIENTSVEMTEVAEPSTEDVSVETQEVAEPSTEDVSVETQEVAEPVSEEQEEVVTTEETEKSGKTDSDSAFAEMRRKLEQAERENQQMIEALSLYFDGENSNDLSVQAIAHAQQKDPAEIQAELDRQRELETLKQENETLKQQAQDLEVQRAINDSLKVLNGLDSSIKTIDDIEKLGDSFLELIAYGIDTETAYYASQAKNYKNKVNAPTPTGKINSVTAERDYYTSDELDNLSKSEIKANWEKVQRSMSLLK